MGMPNTGATQGGEDWRTRCQEYVKLVDPSAPEFIWDWDYPDDGSVDKSSRRDIKPGHIRKGKGNDGSC